jgi:hypothetical protein
MRKEQKSISKKVVSANGFFFFRPENAEPFACISQLILSRIFPNFANASTHPANGSDFLAKKPAN